MLRGRLPAPGRRDEVVLNESAVDALDADVGGHIAVGTLTSEQVDAEDYFPPRGPTLDLTVVGVTRGVDDLAGDAKPSIVATSDLLGTLSGRADEFADYLGVRLRPGTTAADFEEAMRGGIPGASSSACSPWTCARRRPVTP